MEQNKVRIADVAEELGLSTATVSNVLHGKTHKMSEATIKRVEQKLEETGYIPNMAGILLARNNSRIIGVAVNDGYLEDTPGIVNLVIDPSAGGTDRQRKYEGTAMTQFMRSLCKIAISVTLQSMLQASFSIVDQLMIGQLGETNIAAVGICGNYSMLVSVLFSAVGLWQYPGF